MPLSSEQMFSSEKMDWATPWALFNFVHAEFDFSLDAAASPSNAKCSRYITAEEDSFTKEWHDEADGGAVWLNPPYGRGLDRWVEKAYRESLKGCCVVVLTFARTDTRWWHDWAMKAAEIRLIAGRLKFAGAKNAAPAPSCLLIFDERRRQPVFRSQAVPR